ncbi:MAG: hypothetical protein ACYCQI_01645 [Gammaproteobacteria bacterium]
MLLAAIICLLLAIVIGFGIFMHVISDKKIPRILSLTHGPLALTAIILLIIYAYTKSSNPLMIIIGLFVLVALGGLYLFYKDMTGKPVSKGIAVAHAFLAFIIFLILVIFTVVSQQ